MIEFPRNSFWDYSIRLYADQEVAAACLRLQDRRGIDVNVMLFCLWVASSGHGALRDSEVTEALAAVETWHRDVVRQLRALRRRLKGDVGAAPRDLADALRRAVAATEIDAEHIEQLMLAGCLERSAGAAEPLDKARDAMANLSAYLAALDLRPDETDLDDLRALVGAAFPELAAEQISALGPAAGQAA